MNVSLYCVCKCVLCVVWCIIVNPDPGSGSVLQQRYGLLMRSQTCQKFRRPQTTEDCAYRGWKTRWYFPDLLRRGIWMRKRKKTKTNPQSRMFMRQSQTGWTVLVFLSISDLSRGSPEHLMLASYLTKHSVQRPPTTGRVRSIVWWCGFYAGGGQAIRTGHGHLPLQELMRKEELKEEVKTSNTKKHHNYHMMKASMKMWAPLEEDTCVPKE